MIHTKVDQMWFSFLLTYLTKSPGKAVEPVLAELCFQSDILELAAMQVQQNTQEKLNQASIKWPTDSMSIKIIEELNTRVWSDTAARSRKIPNRWLVRLKLCKLNSFLQWGYWIS